MTLAFVFCMGEAILSFRVLGIAHETEKLIHASLHTLAIVLAAIGFTFIVQFHKDQEPPSADFYNIHSTMGLGCLFLYAAQYIAGVLCFYIPKLPDRPRAFAMQFHKWGGMVLFFLAFASILTGIVDRQRLYLNGSGVSNFDDPMRWSNVVGSFVFVTAIFILYHFSPASRKQQPVPELETRLLP